MPVAVYVRIPSWIRPLPGHEAEDFAGTVAGRGVPGPILYRFREMGLPPTSHAELLCYRETPAPSFGVAYALLGFGGWIILLPVLAWIYVLLGYGDQLGPADGNPTAT
jgi:hypothetical protein